MSLRDKYIAFELALSKVFAAHAAYKGALKNAKEKIEELNIEIATQASLPLIELHDFEIDG